MPEIPTYIVMQVQPEGPDLAPVGTADTLDEAEAIAHDPQWLHGGYTTRIYQMLAPTMAMSKNRNIAIMDEEKI